MAQRKGPKTRKRQRKVDSRPYVRDVLRGEMGTADVIATMSGMMVLALAAGFVIGFAVYLLMNLSTWLTSLVWEGYLSGAVGVGWFPLVVCTVGGLIIGVWTHISGDRIKPLHVVMKEFKTTGTYAVSPTKGVVSFLLPLVFGGSIGFEAGLTGLITAGCCWIRDQLKAAGLRVASIADVTIAASLSAIFGAPLAGIVAGAQSDPGPSDDLLEDVDPTHYNLHRGPKVVLYTAAAFGAFGGIKVFSTLFGASAGLPRLGGIEAQGVQYLWAVVALLVAYALTWVYFGSQWLFGRLSERLGEGTVPTIVKPIAAGLVIGALACVLPYVLFPGEEQSHMLMENWTSWTALALIGTGVLKAIATPLCIKFGWIGGNFFPCIFAGIACGYGLSMITGADPMLMVTVVVSAFLAGALRSPVITVAVLILVFPVESVVWMGLAAVIGAALPIPAPLVEAGAA